MRHQRKTVKLGRKAEHRDALLASLACSLIEHKRICTTLEKAKALRPFAEKMVTLGKRGDLHSRRVAIRYLRQPDKVKVLFEKIAPAAANRKGGYTRITRIGRRLGDAAQMAYIEWVDMPADSSGSGKEETKTTEKPATSPSESST